MRAALLEPGATTLRMVDDVDLDAVGLGEVRVAVHWCGLCHSDVSQVKGVHPAMTPSVLGHEAAGEVVEIGPGVTTLKVGDHVVLSPLAACGVCHYCVRGEHSICVNSVAIALGMSPDGTTRLSRDGAVVYRGLGLAAMSEYVVVPQAAAVAIDHDVPLDLACVIGCAVQTGVGAAIYSGGVRPGDSVLVMGAGGIGMSILAGAAAAGATRLILSDPVAERRELALAFGATDLIDPTAADVISEVQRLTGVGVDVAFDAVGAATLVETGMRATRSGGTTVMVGAPGAEEMASVGVAEAMFTQKRLVGSLLGGCHAPRDFPMLIDLWRRGRLPLEKMVTARRPLTEVNEAIEDMLAGRGIRTVLKIQA